MHYLDWNLVSECDSIQCGWFTFKPNELKTVSARREKEIFIFKKSIAICISNCMQRSMFNCEPTSTNWFRYAVMLWCKSNTEHLTWIICVAMNTHTHTSTAPYTDGQKRKSYEKHTTRTHRCARMGDVCVHPPNTNAWAMCQNLVAAQAY